MAEQRKYKTKQREAVAAYLANRRDSYLSVDDVWAGISEQGGSVGRSTVYRCLEAMAAEGLALKATAPGGAARYRLKEVAASGQLVCLGCGRAFALECRTAADFSGHVLEHHGFKVDGSRTVLYGLCSACSESE